MTQTPFSVPTFAPTYADVADAAHRLHGMAHHTPVLRSTSSSTRSTAQGAARPNAWQNNASCIGTAPVQGVSTDFFEL